MPKHTIDDLRAHLFDTLAALRNKDNPMDIERAKAVSDIAQTIINSAKVEVDHLRVTGAKGGSGFLALPEPPAAPPPNADSSRPGNGVQRTIEQHPGVRITRNRI